MPLAKGEARREQQSCHDAADHGCQAGEQDSEKAKMLAIDSSLHMNVRISACLLEGPSPSHPRDILPGGGFTREAENTNPPPCLVARCGVLEFPRAVFIVSMFQFCELKGTTHPATRIPPQRNASLLAPPCVHFFAQQRRRPLPEAFRGSSPNFKIVHTSHL